MRRSDGRARRDGHHFCRDNFGLPVSTTHVLSSGVAGTMAANRSGLQDVNDSQYRCVGLYASGGGAALRRTVCAVPPILH